MYLIFFMLYDLICIPSSAGHVIFAADLDDFRALLQNFIPKNMTDEILLAIATNQKLERGDNTMGFNNIKEIYNNKFKEIKPEKKLNTIKKTPSVNVKKPIHDIENPYRNENKGRGRGSKVKIQDNKHVDQILTASSPKSTKKWFTSSRPNNSLKKGKSNLSPNPQAYSQKLRPKYNSDKKNNDQIHHSDQTKHKQQPLINGKNNKLRKINQKSTRNYENIAMNKKNNNGVYETIDMRKSNDSYEDYVIPKKDSESYENDVSSVKMDKKISKYSYTVKNKDGTVATKKYNKKLDKFTNEKLLAARNNYEKKVPPIDNEGGTTKYNFSKKKRFDVHREAKHTNKKVEGVSNIKIVNSAPILSFPSDFVKADEQPIEPYAEQVPKDYDDETLTTLSGELKARTENLLFEEADEIQEMDEPNSVQLYDKTDKTMSKNKINSHKKKISPKVRTIMPKRDFYRFSSPNYLAKIPVVADKYNFDEPIPEQDRESENLESIAKPPSRINGKIRIS